MATVRKTITLTDQQDDWIKAQVERGDYTNDSEYIRDLIRREQERGLEIEGVRAALIEGEKSGKPKPFDANAFKRRLRRVSWLSTDYLLRQSGILRRFGNTRTESGAWNRPSSTRTY